jgi:hypothetical protein
MANPSKAAKGTKLPPLADLNVALWNTLEATGKDAATVAVEAATGIRVMVTMLKTCAGACIEKSNEYPVGTEARRACYDLATKFLHEAGVIEKACAGLDDPKTALKVLSGAHPKPS